MLRCRENTSAAAAMSNVPALLVPILRCSINRMLEDQTLGLLSCLVVDELHMVSCH